MIRTQTNLRSVAPSIGVLIAILVSINARQTDRWIKFAPIGGGFSVMLPSNPIEETKTSDEFTIHMFTTTTQTTVYIAGYGDYALSLHIDVDRELLANRDNFLKGLNAALTSSKNITLDGHAGLEFTGESDQATFKSRVYVFGNRVHQLGIAVRKGSEDSENVDRFFASFTFNQSDAHSKP